MESVAVASEEEEEQEDEEDIFIEEAITPTMPILSDPTASTTIIINNRLRSLLTNQ